MGKYSFSWVKRADAAVDDVHVGIEPTRHGYWEIWTEGVAGAIDGVTLDDDAASAWSTVAYMMCENGAGHDETADMVNAAPENLEWCFDGQVGMYAYDKNEEWDG